MQSHLIVNELGYGERVCPTEWGMKNEVASFHRVYYVLGGSAFYSSTSKAFELNSNCLYILPSFSAYNLSHNPRNPFHVLYFHIEVHPDILDDIIEIPVEYGSFEKNLLDALTYLSIEKNVEDIEKISDILLRHLENKYTLKIVRDSSLTKVIDYIQNNLTEDIRITRLAEIACMERTYFSKKFKALYGVSPIKYVSNCKMNIASKFLQEKNTVFDTAMAVAYKDEKAFSRAFKKVYGKSPANYVKTHKLQP